MVYAAFDVARQLPIALKTLGDRSAESLACFKRAFRAVQGLAHPNLVALHELWEEDGWWFITMERIDGDDFLAHVATGRRAAITAPMAAIDPDRPDRPDPREPEPHGAATATDLPDGAAPCFDEARLRRALPQLAAGLAALHDAGVIHGDVKPSNVRVAPDGRVVVLDFGLARAVGDADDRAAGTPAYMAPEQAVPGAAGPPADWYALGAMLYEALTGHLPYTGAPADVLFNKRRFAPPPPGAIAAGVPDDLAALCLDLLGPDPGTRPTGAEVLARLLGEPPPRATAPGWPTVPASIGRARELAVPGNPLPEPAAAPGWTRATGDPSIGKTALLGRDRELAVLIGALPDPAAPARIRIAGESDLGQAALGGRDRELALLASALPGPAAPACIRITGESGIGKTALLDAFAACIDPGRAWVLRGRCAPHELVPFRGVDGVVDELAARLARAGWAGAVDPALGAVLVQAFPVLRRVPALAAVAAAGPRETASRVAAALRWLLAHVAVLRPVVIAIDDLQWADRDTVALVRDVLAPPLPRVLAVVASRKGEPALPGTRELALGPLSLEATAGLVRRLAADCADRGIDDVAIAREAGGHPWLATALAHHAAAGPPGAAPITLDDALGHRARRLGPAADRLLAAVCLAHAPIDIATARRATDQPGAAVLDALAVLRASQLVAATGVGTAERLEPYHDRVRQAVVGALAPAARAALHLALASALEAAPAADAEALALHWSEAGYPAAAAAHALRAADEAAHALACHRAARLYRWVIELAPAGFDLGRIRVQHAEALAKAGLGLDAAEAFLACARDHTGAAELRLRRLAMQQLLLMGHTDRAQVLLDELMRDLDLPNPTRPRRVLAALVARRLLLRLRAPRNLRSGDELSPRRLAQIDLTWDATAGLAMVDTLRASYFQSLHLDLAFRGGDPRRLARALVGEIPYLASGGRPGRRHARMLALADDVAARHDLPWLPHAARGVTAFFLAHWRLAYDHLAEAERLVVAARAGLIDDASGPGHARSLTRSMPVAALFFLGRLDELARVTPELLRDALARHDVAAATGFRTGTQVHLWLAQGDVAAAVHHADEGLRPWAGGTRFPNAMDLQARVAIELYTAAGAAVHARVCSDWRGLARAHLLRSQYARVTLLDARGRAALGAAATATGATRAVLVADARRCAARLAREPSVWAHATGLALAAGADLATGARAAGDHRRAAAAATFSAADMPLHAAAVRGDTAALTAAGVVDPVRFARVVFPIAVTSPSPVPDSDLTGSFINR